jgi:sodium/proline symporter
MAGVLTGGLTVVLWKQLHGGLFDLYEIVPGMLLASLAIVVGSLATSPPTAEIQQGFTRFREQLRNAKSPGLVRAARASAQSH